MRFDIYVMSFFITLFFYALGVYDQENHSLKGLVLWFVIFGVIGIWLLATWWAGRSK